nr:reverse transcriptase domain-containing protein [Tanacetum cinerariifolium]
MSTQQDIHAAGSKTRPLMLNKDNYVPWSSRIIKYARSRPNGKMIVDSIENGPYVRRMITTQGEPDLPVLVPESFHKQTDEELTETDIKWMDADDQAIQIILLGLFEDVYAAVDSCETAKEIWERVRQMMKGSDIGEQEKKAKLFNELEKFTYTDGESIESYYHRFMQLMNDLKRNKYFPKNIASNLNTHPQQSFPITNKYNPQPSLNQNFMQPPMTSLEGINDPTKAINAALILFAKAFQLTVPTNNNQRTSSNPRNRQIVQPVMNLGQDRQIQNAGGNGAQNAVQNAGVQSGGNQNGLVVVLGIANQSETGEAFQKIKEFLETLPMLTAPIKGEALVMYLASSEESISAVLLADGGKSEAWDRFKDLLRACPCHGFSKLHQLDTFYNALNSKDQDSLNSADGGNFLDKMPRESLAIIESKSKVCYSRNKPIVAKVSTNTSISGISPDVAAPVKATDGNVYRDNIQEFVSQASAVNYNQGNHSYRPPMMSNQIRPPGFPLVPYVKANDAVMRNMQTQGQSMQNQLTNLTDLIAKFVKSNSASTSSSGTLPSNTNANPRNDLKEITTRGEATKDPVNPTNNRNNKDIQPQVVQSESPILTSKPVTSLISEPVIAPVSASKPNPKTSIQYPSRINDERNREKANNQIEKFYQIFKDMKKLSEMARTPLNEHCSAVLLKKFPKKLGDPGKFLIPCDFPGMAECLALADLKASINLMPFSVCKRLSLPDLTPTCMTLELADHSISRPVGVAEDVYVKVGSFHFPVDFVVIDFDVDPRVPLILGRSFLKIERSLINMFEGELTLRVGKEVITFNLKQTSRYSANYSDMTVKHINVIAMACEEYSQEVLGFLDVISSGNPTPYYDPIVSTTSLTLTPFENRNYLPEVRKELKICKAKYDKSSVDEHLEVELKDIPPHLKYAFLEGDDKLPLIISKDLSVKEKTALITVLKSHKRAIAWKLSDIKAIDPEFYTYKSLMEVDFEPAVQHQRRVNPKIHDVIKQEVIKLLEAGLIYPIFDSPWVSPVHCVPKKGGFTVVENEDNELIPTRLVTAWRDQEKTTFTCPYGTFAYRRMPFGLCNAPGTFQRNSFQSCLSHLERMLKSKGIEVDKAKVDVITKLPHPTTVKGIRSFLGHANFYLHFIKDFSKIARPMTRLLEKDTPFNFYQECVVAFQTLKRKLTEAPILIAPDWDMPFELMCDASDYAIGAVLGQCQDKHFANTLCQAVGENCASWLDKLDDALWAFQTAYKTPIRCTSYKLVYEKACHLPVKLEHKAYWPFKHANFDLKIAGDHSNGYEKKGQNPSKTRQNQAQNRPDTSRFPGRGQLKTKKRKIYMDGASSSNGSRAGLMLVSPEGKEYTYTFRFEFDTTNNEEKYEALLAGLRITAGMKIQKMNIFVDSQTKKEDALSKLALMTFSRLAKEVLVEVLHEKLIVQKEVTYIVKEEGSRSVVSKIMKLGYYWPAMHNDAKALIQRCEACQIHSPIPRKPKQEMASITLAWPFSYCGTTTDGQRRCKVPCRSHRLLHKMGQSKVLSIHNEEPYGEIFYYPQANGQVEVTNRNIVKGMKRRLGKTHQGWMDELPHVLWTHRTTLKSSNGKSPFSLVYGSEAVVTIEISMETNRIKEFKVR